MAPFLRTHVERDLAATRSRRDVRPAVGLALVGAITLGVVLLLWPRPEPPRESPAPPPAPALAPAPRPRPPAVQVVRGDTAATRQAIRKTAKVVPLGFTLDEVIGKFGPPDRVESHPAPGDVTLIYGKVQVELRDGRVVGGSP